MTTSYGVRQRVLHQRLVRVKDTLPLTGHPPSGDEEATPKVPPGKLVVLGKRLLRLRQTRSKFLPDSLFSEPGWDMLLALYCRTAAGERFTVLNLCLETPAPATTANRWVERLFELQLVTRSPNPRDRRSTFIDMTPPAFEMVHAYLIHVWTELHSPT